jgi:DNA-directed RNA polymerase specialized sigma54-like protein
MGDTNTIEKKVMAEPAGRFEMRHGNTTYCVGVHFSKNSNDSVTDKVKKLMKNDVKSGNF